MKIALILCIVCAAALFDGCSTNRGGTIDETNVSTGTVQETEPSVAEPSLPQDINSGPQMPPP